MTTLRGPEGDTGPHATAIQEPAQATEHTEGEQGGWPEKERERKGHG